MTFCETVAASLPDGITLPDAFRKAFDWMEANGCVAASEIAFADIKDYQKEHA